MGWFFYIITRQESGCNYKIIQKGRDTPNVSRPIEGEDYCMKVPSCISCR